jgi:hypothetical protein
MFAGAEPPRAIELLIDGQKTHCTVMRVWTSQDGGTLYQVHNAAHDEMLTLVPDGEDGSVRIIHWGKGATHAPAGTPIPEKDTASSVAADRPDASVRQLRFDKPIVMNRETLVHAAPEISAAESAPSPSSAPKPAQTPPSRAPVSISSTTTTPIEVTIAAHGPDEQPQVLILQPFRTESGVFTPINSTSKNGTTTPASARGVFIPIAVSATPSRP